VELILNVISFDSPGRIAKEVGIVLILSFSGGIATVFVKSVRKPS